MSPIRIRLNTDFRELERLERELPEEVGASVADAARALVEDIRSSWSPTAPSSPGFPPAVRTGNLDESVLDDEQSRDSKGRFAVGENATRHFVRIDTTKGPRYHGRGGYEGYLEGPEGTVNMEPRPFVQPAVERLEAIYTEFFADIFK